MQTSRAVEINIFLASSISLACISCDKGKHHIEAKTNHDVFFECDLSHPIVVRDLSWQADTSGEHGVLRFCFEKLKVNVNWCALVSSPPVLRRRGSQSLASGLVMGPEIFTQDSAPSQIPSGFISKECSGAEVDDFGGHGGPSARLLA